MESKKEKDAFLKISRILSTLNLYQANSVLNNINQQVRISSIESNATKTSRKNKLERDRELYEFILSLDLDFLTQKDIRILCIEKFGAERSPSRTGLSRALKKIQNQKTYLR